MWIVYTLLYLVWAVLSRAAIKCYDWPTIVDEEGWYDEGGTAGIRWMISWCPPFAIVFAVMLMIVLYPKTIAKPFILVVKPITLISDLLAEQCKKHRNV